MSYDTIFQAAVKSAPEANDSERTEFDPAPARGDPQRAAPPAREEPLGAAASELLIDEPEPASDSHGRNPPRPKNRRGGGGAGRNVSGVVKWLAVAALAGAAGFSVYYFVWPLVGGSAETGSSAGSTPAATSIPAATPPSGSASAATTAPPTAATPTTPVPTTPTSPATSSAVPSDPRASASAAATPPVTTSVAPRAGAASPPAATPTSKPPDPVPTPSASGAPKPPPTSSPSGGGGDGRALLQSGNLAAAARAFQREISSASADKFTLALGLYCNEENAGRLVAGAGGSSDIYVLPTSVEGRSCYRVIWGLYDSREAAERGIPSLPSGVRAGDVAPVAVSRFLR